MPTEDTARAPRGPGAHHHSLRGALVAGALALACTLLVVAVVFRDDTAADGRETTIHLLSGGDASAIGVYSELIAEWNARQERAGGEHRAELVEIPGGADHQHAEMARAALAGRGEYDILNVDNQWIAEFARAGWIEPVGSAPEPGVFLDNPLRAVAFDGRAWAVPFTTDVGMLFYRPDQVDPEAVAGDWDEVHPALAELAREAGEGVYAYAGQFDDYEGLPVNALEFVWGNGGDIVRSDGGVNLSSVNNIAGLRRIKQGMHDGFLPPDAYNDDEGAARERFIDGEVLVMRNWPVQYEQLRAGAEGEPGGGEDPGFAMARMPPGMAALGGQSLAVTASSARKEAAEELIAFLTAAEQQRTLFFCGGYAPVRADAYTGEFTGPCTGETNIPPDLFRRVEEKRPYAAELLQAVEEARLRPTTPRYARISATFTRHFSAQLADGSPTGPTAESVRLLEREINRILDRDTLRDPGSAGD